MESNRLKKVAGQMQKDLAEIFREIAQARFSGLMVTITEVAITADLSLARVYISLFPAQNKDQIIQWFNDHKGSIKNQLVKKLKGQLRNMPDLDFRLDDAIEKQENIERILKDGGESPIR